MGNQWAPDKEIHPLQWIFGLFTPYHRKWDQDAANIFREYLATKYNVKSLRQIRVGINRYPNVEEGM